MDILVGKDIGYLYTPLLCSKVTVSNPNTPEHKTAKYCRQLNLLDGRKTEVI